jgi:hypothetical protein
MAWHNRGASRPRRATRVGRFIRFSRRLSLLSERSPDEPEPTPVLRQGKIHANTSKMAKRPERYRNAIVPHIYVDGASDGIAFYEKAFGAVELFRIAHPNGKILHAELEICDSLVILAIQTTGSMASRSPSAAAPPVCTSSSMITKPYCDVPSSRARRRSSRLRKCFMAPTPLVCATRLDTCGSYCRGKKILQPLKWNVVETPS